MVVTPGLTVARAIETCGELQFSAMKNLVCAIVKLREILPLDFFPGGRAPQVKRPGLVDAQERIAVG